MKPSMCSSALSAGHSTLYATAPLTTRQIQVRQVPARHELGRITPAASADASSVTPAWASKAQPPGRSTTG